MRLSGLVSLCLAVAGSAAIFVLMAAAGAVAGEHQSAWLVCELMGFGEVCE